jgi:hypothetical protein
MTNHESCLRLHESGASICESDLSELEARLGFELPSVYRAFLLQNNGGRPAPSRFTMSTGAESIHCFYSLGPPFNIADALWTYCSPGAERIPPKHVPIASTNCGDLIVLNSSSGEAFFWDHEEEGASEFTFNNLTRLGPLTVFLRDLHD